MDKAWQKALFPFVQRCHTCSETNCRLTDPIHRTKTYCNCFFSISTAD